MKKIAFAALLSGAATTAFAEAHTAKGEVVMEMEPVVVVEETQQTSSAAGVVIPLLFIAALAAAASN